MIRSVPVGRSRCSRCCRLIVDLLFHLIDRSWARRLTNSPELGTKHGCQATSVCVPLRRRDEKKPTRRAASSWWSSPRYPQGVDTAKAARSHHPNGQPRASALHRGNSLTAVEAEDAALMTSRGQEVNALDWCSEFDYDPARAPEIALRGVRELRPQPISLCQAYGKPRAEVDVQSPTHCPRERIVGTAQA